MDVYCDASSLISLSSSCLLGVLEKFEKADFYIPKSVYNEAIRSAEEIKKFKWNGIRIKGLVDQGVLKLTEARDEALKFMRLANSLFSSKRKRIKIVHLGEAECVGALIKKRKGVLLVDERNTRMLIEDPLKLKDYIQTRTKQRIEVDRRVLSELKELVGWIPIIRSTDLLAAAYMAGVLKSEEELEAALLSLKYSGCSVTFEEIEEYIRIL